MNCSCIMVSLHRGEGLTNVICCDESMWRWLFLTLLGVLYGLKMHFLDYCCMINSQILLGIHASILYFTPTYSTETLFNMPLRICFVSNYWKLILPKRWVIGIYMCDWYNLGTSIKTKFWSLFSQGGAYFWLLKPWILLSMCGSMEQL